MSLVGGSPWRIAFASCLIQYFIRNIFLLVGLNGLLSYSYSSHSNFCIQ